MNIEETATRSVALNPATSSPPQPLQSPPTSSTSKSKSSTLVPNPLVFNLKVGQQLRNYNGLCDFLNEPHTKSGSTSRVAQEKQFKRMLNWKKVPGSNKLIITEIYPEPLPFIDKRKKEYMTLEHRNSVATRQGKYLPLIEEMMLSYLAYHSPSDGTLTILTPEELQPDISEIAEFTPEEALAAGLKCYTKEDMQGLIGELLFQQQQEDNAPSLISRRWWSALGMINDRYGQANVDDLFKDIKIDNKQYSAQSYLNWFYQIAGSQLHRILKASLNSLKTRHLIDYYNEIVVIVEDENGEEYFQTLDYSSSQRVVEVEKRIRTEMNLTQVQLTYSRYANKFHQAVCSELFDTYYWKNYYRQMCIVFLQPQPRITVEKYHQLQQQLNEMVVKTINKDIPTSFEQNQKRVARNIIEKEVMQHTIGYVTTHSLNTFELPNDYVTVLLQLTPKLIQR